MGALRITVLAVSLALSAVCPVHASTISSADRIALHAAMTQHIDREVVDGMYLRVDLATGAVQRYAPAKAHPMVLKMGDGYVLCTDFKNEVGESSNVDFYVARRGDGFSIFHTEINNRQPLMKLMETGKVVSVE